MKAHIYVLLLVSIFVASSFAIERVSILPGGGGQEGLLLTPLISADGNIVTFGSTDRDFGGGNFGFYHVYSLDRTTGLFQRISVETDGSPSSRDAFVREMSDSGRYVLFESEDDLDPNDTTTYRDVYLRDRTAIGPVWASKTHDGGVASAACLAAGVSDDGRYVVFRSSATNLVTPATAAAQTHVYLRDMNTGAISIVSQSTNGTLANGSCSNAKISADGRYVVFSSDASNLLDGGLDTNGDRDIFLRDLQANPSPTTTRVSLTDNDGQIDQPSYDPDMSSDGMVVSFRTYAQGVVAGINPIGNFDYQVYVRDRNSDTTKHVSRPTGGGVAELKCEAPTISANGRYVVFYSKADNIAPGTSGDQDDTFSHDLQTGVTSRVSVSESGELGDSYSYEGVAANDGTVLFRSYASNFVPDDTEGEVDLFVAPANAPVAFVPAPPSAGGGDPNAALRASLLNKLKKLKKKAKNAKGTPKGAKFKKKIKALNKKIKAL